ncbi:MAG: HipA domain-containing protein [Clostridia bacterium]|nr:HipA domain-containing protein [Clostridia bacterium]
MPTGSSRKQTSAYTLMHGNLAVASLDLNSQGIISGVHEVLAPGHLPVGVKCHSGVPSPDALNLWWRCRGIPATRQGLRRLYGALNLHSTSPLLKRSLGLSLTDQYWIRPEGSNLSWQDVNFFMNPFSGDIGDILFGLGAKPRNDLSYSSPDIACGGNLMKRWREEGGRRWLIKGSCGYAFQEPVNELTASKVADLLGLPHIPYYLYWRGGLPYSACEDFISADTELIPAYDILVTRNKSPQDTPYRPYDYFLECCTGLGIHDPRAFLDRMIVFDYIIANEDRHLYNFGFIRNARALEWLGPAPLYDNGSSLGFYMSGYAMHMQKPSCKPFYNDPDMQLSLVSDYAWLPVQVLNGVPDIISDTLADLPEGFMSKDRQDAILDTARERLNHLKELISRSK